MDKFLQKRYVFGIDEIKIENVEGHIIGIECSYEARSNNNPDRRQISSITIMTEVPEE